MLNRDARLRVFHNVALHRSFTKAADLLCLTQQAVSFQIKSLEDEVGAKLFVRSASGADLTPAGQQLFGYSGRILALYDEAEKAIAEHKQTSVHRVFLGATGTIARHPLPRLIEQFRRERPEVHLSVRIGNSQHVLEWLAQDAVDIGIVSAGPVVLGSQRITPWFRDALVLIAPPGHRWHSCAPVGPEALQREPFVIREKGSGSRMLIEELLGDLGLALDTMNVVLEVQSTEAVKAAVLAGVGSAIVSALSLEDSLLAGSCVALAAHGKKWERDFYIVTPQRSYHNAVTSAFLAALESAAPR
jgi:LysR family transcriptional regulator, transcriptional activator of the cysJI operon